MASGREVGVDLGGTKIEVAALDADRRMLERHRIATPAGDTERSWRRSWRWYTRPNPRALARVFNLLDPDANSKPSFFAAARKSLLR